MSQSGCALLQMRSKMWAIGSPRVALDWVGSQSGSKMSCFSAAHAMVRGFSAAWPFLREALAFGGCLICFSVWIVVVACAFLFLLFPLLPWPWPPSWAGCKYGAPPLVRRRPGRCESTGLEHLAFQGDPCGQQFAGSAHWTTSATFSVCWRND